ncbi:MAG TPA: 30S ribosomal protein S8 [Candidatus Paceibacterota bacterium]
MVKDTIANLIIKIKNAGNAGKESISAPNSNLTSSILTLLEKEGYIKSFSKKAQLASHSDLLHVGEKAIKFIDIEIAYDEEKKPKIEGVERISKLSRRVYTAAKNIRPVRSGYGMLVLSTPKGIVSDTEARKLKVGGEVLFKIW